MLPAAIGISSEAVLQLLQAAVGKGARRSVKGLCRLPAVAQLTSEAVVALLAAAVKRNSPWTIGALTAALPVVLLEQLSIKQLKQLIAAAARQRNNDWRSEDCIAERCKLKARLNALSSSPTESG
jgi:hypothetical protein